MCILAAAIAVIAFGRGTGWTSIKPRSNPHGLIAASSDPTGAQVFVDGTLKPQTNNSFGIDPAFTPYA